MFVLYVYLSDTECRRCTQTNVGECLPAGKCLRDSIKQDDGVCCDKCYGRHFGSFLKCRMREHVNPFQITFGVVMRRVTERMRMDDAYSVYGMLVNEQCRTGPVHDEYDRHQEFEYVGNLCFQFTATFFCDKNSIYLLYHKELQRQRFIFTH